MKILPCILALAVAIGGGFWWGRASAPPTATAAPPRDTDPLPADDAPLSQLVEIRTKLEEKAEVLRSKYPELRKADADIRELTRRIDAAVGRLKLEDFDIEKLKALAVPQVTERVTVEKVAGK
jgi:hypothetical protein